MHILGWIVFGFVVGLIARFLMPGRQPMGFIMTTILGIVGSFVGGFLGWAIFGHDASQGALQPSGLIGSIIGAVILLLILRAVRNRSGSRRYTRV